MKYNQGDIIVFPANKTFKQSRSVKILGVDKTGSAKGQYLVSDFTDFEQVAHWWDDESLNNVGATLSEDR